MPNQVDGNVQGAAPAAARPEARQAETAAQRQQEATTQAPDRVEISQEGQDAAAADAPQAAAENTRGAASNTPGAAPPPEVEQREANLEEQRETATREQQDTARQQNEAPETGNLVDVTGG